MSLNPEQQSLKEQGNKALAEGDAPRATALFTKALEIEGGTNAGRAILYSNRAAASMMTKDHQSALEDSESCIRLDADFAKGWSRKAAALYALGTLDKAAEFYRIAATKATSPEAAEEYNKQAAQCESGKSSAPSAKEPSFSYSAGSSSTSSSSSPSTSVEYPLPVIALRLVSFALALGWLVTGDSQFYGFSMIVMGAASMFLVVREVGAPKLSVDYVEKFLAVKAKPVFILPFVYASLGPVFPALMATQLVAVGPLARSMHGLLARYVPGVANTIGSKVKDSQVFPRFMGIQEWNMLSTSERFARFDRVVDPVCSRFELAVMLILVLQLFTPAANIVSILVYSQVLKFRYLTDDSIRQTIHNMDAGAASFAQKNAVANKVYGNVRNAVAWFGTQGVRNAQARQTAGGNAAAPSMGNCVVM